MEKEIGLTPSVEIDAIFTDENKDSIQDLTFVLFGATGDLAKRKLFPALYNLYLEKKIPHTFSVIGLGRSDWSHEAFRLKVKEAIETYSRQSVQEDVDDFLTHFQYSPLDVKDPIAYEHLHTLIQQCEENKAPSGNRLFYLSVAPNLVETIIENINLSKLNQTTGWKKLVIEKPFGTDLKTAQHLNHKLSEAFDEKEIYRIDHYLGKPMVQNLASLVFANPALAALLDVKQISNVQITASELVGVETRADYYDHAGAIRDMVQNHLLQLVMMTALHLPKSMTAADISQQKMDILNALRLVEKDNVQQHVIRAQYDAGGTHIRYGDEPGVAKNSMNDTYFAARLQIDNDTWRGIPFYIRTGKRLDKKSTRIVFEFKNPLEEATPNLLILEINPNESITLKVNLKDVARNEFVPTDIQFNQNSESIADAYELLLFDAMIGNATFFAHWNEVEHSWKWIQPILEAFDNQSLPLHTYPAGSTGPTAADELLQEDGFNWWA